VLPMRALIWLVLAGAFYWAVRQLLGKGLPHQGPSEEGSEEMVRDPQCGVYVPVTSAIRKKAGGEMVYFCSKECEEKYSGNSGV
jgi:YHS domain-containing protein